MASQDCRSRSSRRARTQHADLGAPFVLDVGSNACTGFMYALAIGSSMMQALGYRRVACLAIEFSSRCIAYDPLAFGTSTLFGDAAAGVLLGQRCARASPGCVRCAPVR